MMPLLERIRKEGYDMAQSTQYRTLGFRIYMHSETGALRIEFLDTTPEAIRSLLARSDPCIVKVHCFLTKVKLLGIEVKGWI